MSVEFNEGIRPLSLICLQSNSPQLVSIGFPKSVILFIPLVVSGKLWSSCSWIQVMSYDFNERL